MQAVFTHRQQHPKLIYNIMRKLTKDQLKVILKEHVINGQNLYYKKWAYEEQIKTCTTIEELNTIELKFTMKDFSK